MSLKRKTIVGIAWNSAGNILRQILQFVYMIVMARLLNPEDFGIYAILMIFVSFMDILGQMGLSQALIHLKEPNKKLLSSIFYLNLFVGVLLFISLYYLAKPISGFFSQPELIPLLQLTGVNFIIRALVLVQKTIFEKKLNFGVVIRLETASLFVGYVFGVAGAFYQFGVYSLIIATMANSLALAFGLWLFSDWYPSLEFSTREVKKILSYSVNLTGFSIINYFARQSDNFLIGKYLGSSVLGTYSIAYKIMLYPLANVSRVLIRVLFPAFAAVKEDNHRFRKAYLKAISFVALVTFPITMGLMTTAESLVKVFFGDKWLGLEELLVIMSPIALVQSIVTTMGVIFTAKGSTSIMFKIGLLNAFATVISFVIGLQFGVKGVVTAYAFANLLMLYPNLKTAWSQIGLGVWQGLKTVRPFFVGSIVLAFLVRCIGKFLLYKNFAPISLALFIQVISGVFIYFLFMLGFYKKTLLELFAEVRLR